jgi:hypothetical protein
MRNNPATHEEVVEYMIEGSSAYVKDKNLATSQMKKLVKYHTMRTGRLAKMVNLRPSVIRRFKKIFKERGVQL